MGLKLSVHSIASTLKSVTSTVTKTVSKVTGSSSSSKTSSTSKSGSSSSKTSSTSKSGSSSSKTSSTSKSGSSSSKTSATSKSGSPSSKTSATSKSGSSSSKSGTASKSSSPSSKTSATSKSGSPSSKYVTDAPALYNASGKKTSGTSASSMNRPAESYEAQKKALEAAKNKKTSTNGTTKHPTLKPVAIKVPAAQKKKDSSEKGYSNNRPAKSYTHVKDYTPTASREGAGKPFYHSGTVAKGVASGVAGLLPYAGDVKDVQEAVTGRDLITGTKLTKGERIVTGAAAVLPVVSGPMLKTAGKGVTIAAKEAPEVIKGVEKTVKKAGPKAVSKADEGIKAAKKAVVKKGEKIKDATVKGGKKTEKAVKENVSEAKRVAGTVHKGGKDSTGYKYWKESINFQGNKVYQRNDLFDPAQVSSWKDRGKTVTGTNVERMAGGRAPIGYDGKSVNLHHLLQTPDGPIVEVSQSFHNKYYSTIHMNIGQSPSIINRDVFKRWKSDYWMDCALDFD
ncbi:HNH/ENDO VII family nuclease [[Clostridium] polysaccharolyticum]|uniref:Pre-toxin TG n=1 Tax=[Clostridium] polysaccharolyticum TaxID=29364 RepID=A0A1I0CBS7_9FIRM|nr:HNH/ENDO VII family nuclease [[Clostridium] polysaccharolyticum]SET16721.1 Pre-toxin TG [[Clostridium] polysaccharolyticum]